MPSFEFIAPQRIVFGQGRIKEIGRETGVYGKRALLVTGRRAARETGILKEATDALTDSCIETTLFDQVVPEPAIEVVDEGISLSSEKGCDLVIGLGGGSALDVAKAIAFLCNLPFMAVPTTAGTGSEATYNSVITYPAEKIKKSIRDPRMMAKVAIVDPGLVVSCPKEVTIFSGLDALVHLVEGFVSKAANPLTDSLAISGIELIHQALKRTVGHPEDIEARTKMSLAALMGGMVLANAGLGAVHGLASSIGGRSRHPHGLICAVLLPWIMEYNLEAAHHRFGQIAAALNSEDAIGGIRDLLSDLAIADHLGPLGIDEEMIPAIIRDASGSIRFNPRETDMRSLSKLLRKAL